MGDMKRIAASDTVKEPPSNEALIQMAYSLVLGPERYEDLLEALDARMQENIQASLNGQGVVDPVAITEIEAHFDSALNLLRAQGRRKMSASGAIRTLDASARPAMTLAASGRIQHANPTARIVLGTELDSKLETEQFEVGHFDTLMDKLRDLDSQPENAILAIVGMISADGEDTIKMALSRAPDWEGRPIGLLSALHISWYPDVGQQFQSMMGLTQAELAITRAVVTGLPLSELARQRGRKVTTVRNQTKALLKKLGVRSQTELACLYSGFSQFSLEGSTRTDESRLLPKPRFLALSDGHCIDISEAGPKRGKPVLFLPALMGGRAMTDGLRAALHDHNVRLIMPWRPGFSRSFNTRLGRDIFADVAAEIEAVLDDAKLASVPVVGQMTSTMFAFAAAKHLPERIERVVGINPGLPSVRGPHLRHIGRMQKLRSFIAREAPRTGHLIAHAFLSRVDAGYDVEFIRHYLKASPADLAFSRRQDTMDGFRLAYEETHAQGYEGFIAELGYFARDWHPLTEGLTCPVDLVVGEEESHFPAETVKDFAAQFDSYTVTVVPEAGHLAFYEKPDSWLAKVKVG